MKPRAVLILALTLARLAAPVAAEAQEGAKVPRIGFLATNSPAEYPDLLGAFRQGLGDPGFVEGQNIAIEYRWAKGRVERFSDLAVELVGLKEEGLVTTLQHAVDVLRRLGTPAGVLGEQWLSEQERKLRKRDPVRKQEG